MAPLRLIRRYPVRSGLALAIAAASIFGLWVGAALMFPAPVPLSHGGLLADALEHLDAGDLNQARRLAAQLNAQKSLTFVERGGPLFVQGAVTLAEAEPQLDSSKRRVLSLIAARTLEEARNHGWPRGRSAQGLTLLGKALHAGGRYPDSLPILRQALAADPEAAPHLLPLLVDCCLRLTPARLAEALQSSEQYLALSGLTPAERHAGLLVQSRILLEQGALEAAWRSAAEVPPDSAESADAAVAQGQIAVAAWRSGRELKAEPTVTAAGLIARLKATLGNPDLSLDTVAPIQLLIGLATEQIPDPVAASAQYQRVHTNYFGRPESVAAEVFHASLLVEKNPAEAVKLFAHALAEANNSGAVGSVWLSEARLKERLERALDQLLAARRFSLAIELAQAMPLALSATDASLDELRVHRAWAEQLQRDAAAQHLVEAEVTLAEARDQWRQAGTAGKRLAELRYATRHYVTDLRGAAGDLMRGQGYRQAAAIWQTLLDEEPRTGRPEVLLGLGESLLALGDTAAAYEHLQACIDEHPQHPASYRARLLASQALVEQGAIDQAKALLTDNLYGQALTPQSDDWRDSLFAYGFLLYREGLALETKSRQGGIDLPDPEAKRAGLALLEQSHAEFQLASRALREAVERYPTAPAAIRARYAIAESYRHSAKWPRKRLGTITIETTRVALNRQLQEELQESLNQYAALIAELADGKDADKSPTELAILRNCYFSRADVLFDLGRYQDAVQAYSAATNRYQHEPEALEAYVQIAACLRRLNRTAEARGTLEQARIVLQRLRPDADFTKTTRYTRDEWTQLLGWLRTL
jgi:TolA-binding protein